jgi:uncharacterized membrane-anchored protein YjiN (DUF445 family)
MQGDKDYGYDPEKNEFIRSIQSCLGRLVGEEHMDTYDADAPAKAVAHASEDDYLLGKTGAMPAHLTKENTFMSKEDLIKSLIREELTKTDKAEIRRMISKELDSSLKKELKKALEDELSKALNSKATKEEIAEITKKVMKKLYKDLSFHHPYIIDRIKV